MVVSFPPADPAAESSETLAPVTSLFGRRAAPAAATEQDAWFAGEPVPKIDEPAQIERPIAPLRRLATTGPVPAEAVDEETQNVVTPQEPAATTPRIAWTPTPGSSRNDTDDADDDIDEPVDAEVRLAELDLLAVRRLARRGCSEWEIAELLRGHDAEPHEVEHVLTELRRRGYLDDAELARQLVESLHTRKGQSRAVIGRELSSRRIDPSVAAEALEAIDDDDELRRALVVAEKRAGQLRSLDQATAERRLSAYLARRGYGSAIIREACTRALSGSKRSGVTFR
ncbi:MAG TPA: regulatory protein RecX [Plantibacter sp.]|uniref:regulatory protein RecX n=1 Tax=unclassified Plantibacter TaxID=2624265 RepID=UPI002B6B5ABB|nr:regulatory protein RecX [Plantibacter sp.]